MTAYSAVRGLYPVPRFPRPGSLIMQGLVFVLASTLIVTVRAAGAVTGERERDTWLSLRLTPLEDAAMGDLLGRYLPRLSADEPHALGQLGDELHIVRNRGARIGDRHFVRGRPFQVTSLRTVDFN